MAPPPLLAALVALNIEHGKQVNGWMGSVRRRLGEGEQRIARLAFCGNARNKYYAQLQRGTFRDMKRYQETFLEMPLRVVGVEYSSYHLECYGMELLQHQVVFARTFLLYEHRRR